MQVNLDSRFAGVIDLGAPLAQHALSRRGRLESLLLALVCFAALPVLLTVTAERYDLANHTDSPLFVNTSPWHIYWPVILALPPLLSGIWLLFNMARNWKTAVVVYQHGLALYDHTGLRQIRWDAVDEVRQSLTRRYRNGLHNPGAYKYSVQTKDGKKLKFDNRFTLIEQLGDIIQEYVSNALLPRYMHALNNGQRLTFGPLGIDREGLYLGNEALQWREIATLKIENGNIAIQQDGGRCTWTPISVAQVPNLLVFDELVGWMTSMRKTARCPT